MEGWRTGALEHWRTGGLEGWRDGGMEGWRDGVVEGWSSRASLVPFGGLRGDSEHLWLSKGEIGVHYFGIQWHG
jgi:hypothetical protein